MRQNVQRESWHPNRLQMSVSFSRTTQQMKKKLRKTTSHMNPSSLEKYPYFL